MLTRGSWSLILTIHFEQLAVVICAVAADPYNAKNYQAPKQDEYVQPVTNKEPKVMSYQLDDHSVKIITYHNPRARTYQQDVYYTAPDATYEAPKVPSYKKEEYPSQPVTTYQAPSYEQPKEYEPKPMTYQQDSYTKEENHETTSFATAEDCEKVCNLGNHFKYLCIIVGFVLFIDNLFCCLLVLRLVLPLSCQVSKVQAWC